MGKFLAGAFRAVLCLTASLTLVAISQVHAEDAVNSSTTEVKGVNDKTYGLYISIGNPYPTLLGVNAAYNINKDIRASIGYGELEVTTSLDFNSSGGFTEQKIKAQTYAAGVEYLFFDTAVRAIVGAHAGYFSVSGKGEFSIDGFDKSMGYGYANAGIDWTTQSGFNLGAGANVALLGAKGTGAYVNTGYYF